jgi:hypothetical protein
MDILVSLNIRKRSFSGQYDVNKCVICQENKTDALEHKKQRGIQTLKERASQRQKICLVLGNKPPSSDHNFAFRSLPDEFCCQKEGQFFFIFRQRKKTWQIRITFSMAKDFV